MTEIMTNWPDEEFRGFSDRLLAMMRGNCDIRQTEAQIADFIAGHNLDAIVRKLLDAVSLSLLRNHAGVVAEFERLVELIPKEQYNLVPALFNIIWFDSQLALGRHENPINRICHQNFRNNIKALEQVDPELAGLIRKSTTHADYRILKHWNGLHFFDISNTCLLTMSDNVRKMLSEKIEHRTAIAIDGINSGQEMIYYLQNSYKGLHGMARAHYLLEEDLGKLRSFLELFDGSQFILSDQLIILGGENRMEKLRQKLLSCRYPIPMVRLEHGREIDSICKEVITNFKQNDQIDILTSYYRSSEFTDRLQKISKGEILPRILFSTCRWTTFLKHCAADFDRAFQALGCQTYYLIEESDTQTLSSHLHKKVINDLKPDMVFMVSHARPSLAYIPNELPVVCFMQDKCGPLLTCYNLGKEISKNDLFICMLDDFQSYLISKGVRSEQIRILPVPADPEMFYPLPAEDPGKVKYQADVAFVKHGSACCQEVHNEFIENYILKYFSGYNLQFLMKVFNDLLEFVTSDPNRCIYEPEMQEFCRQYLHESTPEESRQFLSELTTTFYLNVYSAAWRFRFLETLANAGIELALYGNNWEKNRLLSKYARGAVSRGEPLNYVYNFSKINLSINHATSMHQRLVECSLAGGFIMVAGHDRANDGSYAGNYYKVDDELILFNSVADLLDKTRYFLTHDQKRLEIAQNMRSRSLAEYSTKATAGTILEIFKKRLAEGNII